MSQHHGVADDDRGLAYGDGCFETIRVARSRAPLLDRHLDRLARGAERLAITLPKESLRVKLEKALADTGDGVIKIILTRGSGGRGYRVPEPQQPRLILQTLPLPAIDEHCRSAGLSLHLCHLRLASQPVLAGMKHLNRLEQVLARQETDRAGLDEGLLLDNQGCPVELTSMNLFARFADTLWTPPLTDCGVAGVMRDYLLDSLLPGRLDSLLPDGRLQLQIGHRPLAALRQADEIFACNSVAGILPVRKLGLWQWPVGNTTIALQQSVDELWQ